MLVFFHRTVYPEVDHGPEQKLMDRVTKAILSESTVDIPTAVRFAVACAVKGRVGRTATVFTLAAPS